MKPNTSLPRFSFWRRRFSGEGRSLASFLQVFLDADVRVDVFRGERIDGAGAAAVPVT